MFERFGENIYSEKFDANDLKNKLTLYLYNLVKCFQVKESIKHYLNNMLFGLPWAKIDCLYRVFRKTKFHSVCTIW